MTMQLLLVVATLAVVVALFFGRFRAAGLPQLLRLAVAWAVIVVVLVWVARSLGWQLDLT